MSKTKRIISIIALVIMIIGILPMNVKAEYIPLFSNNELKTYTEIKNADGYEQIAQDMTVQKNDNLKIGVGTTKRNDNKQYVIVKIPFGDQPQINFISAINEMDVTGCFFDTINNTLYYYHPYTSWAWIETVEINAKVVGENIEPIVLIPQYALINYRINTSDLYKVINNNSIQWYNTKPIIIQRSEIVTSVNINGIEFAKTHESKRHPNQDISNNKAFCSKNDIIKVRSTIKSTVNIPNIEITMGGTNGIEYIPGTLKINNKAQEEKLITNNKNNIIVDLSEVNKKEYVVEADFKATKCGDTSINTSTISQNNIIYETYESNVCNITIDPEGTKYNWIENDGNKTCNSYWERLWMDTNTGKIMKRTEAPLLHQYSNDLPEQLNCTVSDKMNLTCDNNCSNAAVIVDNLYNSKNHKWSEWKSIPKGTDQICESEQRECIICHTKEIRYIDPMDHDHDYELIKTVPESCEEDGYNLFKCKQCGYEKKEIIKDAHRHMFVHPVFDRYSTEQNSRFVKSKCVFCGKEIKTVMKSANHQHEYVKTYKINPTCTEKGYTLRYCKCGYIEKIMIEQKLNHEWSEWYKEGKYEVRKCKLCNDIERRINNHTHDFVKTETVNPSCENPGYDLFECSCGEKEKRNEVPALGHTWGEWKETVPATEEKTGTEERSCAICNTTQTRTIEKLPHSHQYSKTIITPTCIDEGYSLYECKCGHSYKEEYTKALGHDWNEWIIEKEPTETEDGYKTRTCKRCDASEQETIKAIPHTHTYKETVITPTCTEQGYTLYQCDCGEKYIDSYVDPLGHKWSSWEIKTEATEESDGVEQRTCSVCQEVETRKINKIPHTHKYEITVMNPTCIAPGYTLHECKCGNQYKDTYTLELGHDWSEWEITKESSENQVGLKERICRRCGEHEAKEVEKLPHTHQYQANIIKPTCVEKGYTEYVCKCGDKYIDNYTDKTPHNWSDWNQTVKPTETMEGTEQRECSFCGKIESKQIPKLEHTHKYETTVINPTCTTDGYTIHKCICGYEYKDNIIKAKGHKYIANKKDATCENEGYINYVCSECKDSYKETIKSLGHDWSDWKIKEKATSGKEGVEYRICNRCNKEESRTIKMNKKEENKDPKLGFEGYREQNIWFLVLMLSTITTSILIFIYNKKSKE